MSDFWAEASLETDIVEPPRPQFDTVPDKAYVLIKNTTREHKEGAQPKIITATHGDNSWFKFKTAFLVTGGDDKIKPAHVGRYIFFECSTHRNEEKDNPAMPCSGPLYNLILDSLAPIDAPTPERWAKARAILAKKGAELAKADPPVTLESCNGDTQYLYSVTFKELLLDKSYQVIAQTYTPRPKPGKSFQPGQTVGSITADMTSNRTEKKVKLIEAESKGDF
jgi:hypothetical protein